MSTLGYMDDHRHSGVDVVDVGEKTILRERNIDSLQKYHDRCFIREES